MWIFLKKKYDLFIGYLQLKSQETYLILGLLVAMAIGHVVLFWKTYGNPTWMQNVRIESSADSLVARPTAAHLLAEVNRTLAAADTADLTQPLPADKMVEAVASALPGSTGAGASLPAETRPGPKQATSKININTASALEMQDLPGIGPKMAARIIDFRIENDGFKRPEDLMEVKGIGRKTFEKLKPFIRVEDE